MVFLIAPFIINASSSNVNNNKNKSHWKLILWKRKKIASMNHITMNMRTVVKKGKDVTIIDAHVKDMRSTHINDNHSMVDMEVHYTIGIQYLCMTDMVHHDLTDMGTLVLNHIMIDMLNLTSMKSMRLTILILMTKRNLKAC